MQEFLHSSRFREGMDDLGFRCAAAALCFGWFIFLWGVTAVSLLSGAALTLLVFLIRRKTRDGRLKRREARLRQRIGGEMALEKLLLASPRRANFEAALLLSRRYPLTLLRTGDEGTLCSLRGEKVLLSFCALPASAEAGPERVLQLQRAVLAQGASRGILCLPCSFSPQAAEQARGEIPVSFLSRDTLISLFGSAHPVTDQQLVALGNRRRQRPGAWLPMIFHPARAMRYLGYGALLLGMHLLTGQTYYVVPGLLCMGMAAACRCVRPKEEIL